MSDSRDYKSTLFGSNRYLSSMIQSQSSQSSQSTEESSQSSSSQ